MIKKMNCTFVKVSESERETRWRSSSDGTKWARELVITDGKVTLERWEGRYRDGVEDVWIDNGKAGWLEISRPSKVVLKNVSFGWSRGWVM